MTTHQELILIIVPYFTLQILSSYRLTFIFSLASKVGDTARDMAVRNGYKKIAKLLAPARGDTLKVSGSLTLKKSLRGIGFPGFCVEKIFA